MKQIFSERTAIGGYEIAQVVDAHDGQRVERDWRDVYRITTAYWDKGTGVLVIDHQIESRGYAWGDLEPERRYATHQSHSAAIRAVIADADQIDAQILEALAGAGDAEVSDEDVIAAWPVSPLDAY